MKTVNLDERLLARKIRALKPNRRSLEESLGVILDGLGDSEFPLDDEARDELIAACRQRALPR